jgi:hypothetical protein
MSFEIQVHTQTMVALLENTLQLGFRTTCLPSVDPFYVDHVDVRKGQTTVNATSSSSIDFVVSTDVFIVLASAVLAAPNGIPNGATTSAGQVSLTLRLSVSGSKLTMACTGVDLGALGKALGSNAQVLAQQIQNKIGTVGSIDVGPLASKIGLPAPSSSSLAIVGASILIRFDPSSAGQERLQMGQDWCLFVEAAAMQQLVTIRLDTVITGLGQQITSHTTTATWAPLGSIPRVIVSVDGKAQVPDPFAGNVHVGMIVDFGLIHTFIVNDGIGTDLVLDVAWDLKVDLGEFVPQFIDDLVVAAIKAQVDPKKFGATSIGPQEFEMLFPLPPLTFGAATFEYKSIVGIQAGMVLGGPVKLPIDPGTSTLSFNVIPFAGSFALTVDCSQAGAAEKPTLGTVSASGAASYANAGVICDIHFVSPVSPPVPLAPYLNAPPNGTITETGVIAVTLPGVVAYWLSFKPQPVQLWVQTARGVRLLDLGTPPTPKLDDNGNVINYNLVFINDCPSALDPWFKVFHMYNPKWSIDPPEAWENALEQVERFETLMLDVAGLAAGSVVRFDTPRLGTGVGAQFSADSAGRVLVPAVLATRSNDEGARLSTADRQALGDVLVSTAVFERIAVLETPGATSHTLVEAGGAALITSTFRDGRTQTVRLDGLRIPRVLSTGVRTISGGSGALGALQSATPIVPGRPPSADLPGLVALHTVPGFEASGLQVAELEDQTHVVVVEESGKLHAIGTLPAWPHMPPAGEAWAISASTGERVAVFAVTRQVPEPGREPSACTPAAPRESCQRSLPPKHA